MSERGVKGNRACGDCSEKEGVKGHRERDRTWSLDSPGDQDLADGGRREGPRLRR